MLSHFKRALSVLLCATLLGAVVPAQAAASASLTVTFSVTTYQNRARTMLQKINALRKANGLPELVMLSDLEKVAVQRASELFVHFDHTRPDMTSYATADDEFTAVRGCLLAGESIAAGYSSADEMFEEWSSDPDAAKNLLSEDFTHVGIACVQVPGSYNGYYWVAYFQQQKDGFKATKAPTTAKAAVKRSVSVELKRGLFTKADSSHKGFELRADDLNLKSRKSAQAAVYLYDQRGVKIGLCAAKDLTYTNDTTSVCTVLKSGVIQRKKAGSSKITAKFNGLGSVTFAVTFGGSSASSNSVALTAPELTAKAYPDHTTLSAYVKGASGYVLYRCSTKTGTYRKVEEAATTKRWSMKLENDDMTQTWYYKVKAYKNVSGKRVYSEYSNAVKVSK